MPRVSDAFLAELGLEGSGPRPCEWGDDPGSEIQRAGLTHPVLCRMLESVETLAPFLKLNRDVVFAMLRDLVSGESERSPFGLVARDPESDSEREPVASGSIGLGETLSEAAKLIDARHGQPRAPEWAVPLDAEQKNVG